LLILFILILSLVLAAHYNNSPGVIISRVFKDNPAYSGVLKYRVYFLGFIPMGEAKLSPPEIEEYQGQKVYHLHGVADSFAIYSKFYRAHAEIDSYLDLKKLNPVLFKQRLVVSGKTDIYKEALYDQDNGIMTMSGVKRQIFPDTQDPLSSIFHIRHMDFKHIRDFEIGINSNQKNYIMKCSASLNSLIINKIRRDTVLLQALISRRDKNPYHKSSMKMVLLEGQENIPVLVKVFASGILIYARLVDIK